MPPTFAAAFITISGLFSSIKLLVLSKSNKFTSFLDDGIKLISGLFENLVTIEDPTSPLLPKTITLIFTPIKFNYNKICLVTYYIKL